MRKKWQFTQNTQKINWSALICRCFNMIITFKSAVFKNTDFYNFMHSQYVYSCVWLQKVALEISNNLHAFWHLWTTLLRHFWRFSLSVLNWCINVIVIEFSQLYLWIMSIILTQNSDRRVRTLKQCSSYARVHYGWTMHIEKCRDSWNGSLM